MGWLQGIQRAFDRFRNPEQDPRKQAEDRQRGLGNAGFMDWINQNGDEENASRAASALDAAREEVGPTYTEPEQPLSREEFMAKYSAWLEARIGEAGALQGERRVELVDGLLGQIEDVCSRFNNGQQTDIDKLDTTPSGGGEVRGDGFVPPELIPVARRLIRIVEQPIEGAEQSAEATAESSLYSDVDWNSRLGVPQYRNQRDNLVDPDVTCNVTTFSMLLERLGYSREDVMGALVREVKRRQSGNKDKSDAELDAVELDEAVLNREIQNYFTQEGVRGVDPAEFTSGAQMEMLVDMLLDMIGGPMGLDRYAISETALGNGLLGAIGGGTQDQRVWAKWNDARADLDAHLKTGGAVMLSLDIGSSTHLVSLQQVVSGAAILDDPFGLVRESYRKDRGHAYLGGAEGDIRNDKGDGWTASAAREQDEGELRGDSAEVSDKVMQSALQYYQLFHRAGSQPASS